MPDSAFGKFEKAFNESQFYEYFKENFEMEVIYDNNSFIELIPSFEVYNYLGEEINQLLTIYTKNGTEIKVVFQEDNINLQNQISKKKIILSDEIINDIYGSSSNEMIIEYILRLKNNPASPLNSYIKILELEISPDDIENITQKNFEMFNLDNISVNYNTKNAKIEVTGLENIYQVLGKDLFIDFWIKELPRKTTHKIYEPYQFSIRSDYEGQLIGMDQITYEMVLYDLSGRYTQKSDFVKKINGSIQYYSKIKEECGIYCQENYTPEPILWMGDGNSSKYDLIFIIEDKSQTEIDQILNSYFTNEEFSLFSTNPFVGNEDKFNIYYLKLDLNTKYKETSCLDYYRNNGISKGENKKIVDSILNNYNQFDGEVYLTNDPKVWSHRSGDRVYMSFSCINQVYPNQDSKIFVHEFGHLFANLKDEYVRNVNREYDLNNCIVQPSLSENAFNYQALKYYLSCSEIEKTTYSDRECNADYMNTQYYNICPEGIYTDSNTCNSINGYMEELSCNNVTECYNKYSTLTLEKGNRWSEIPSFSGEGYPGCKYLKSFRSEFNTIMRQQRSISSDEWLNGFGTVNQYYLSENLEEFS
jgi:hypothetical protein